MSRKAQDEKPLLTVAEQEVRIVVEKLVAENGGKIPGLGDVQTGLDKRGFRHRSISRISRILSSLEEKGRIRYWVEVL